MGGFESMSQFTVEKERGQRKKERGRRGRERERKRAVSRKRLAAIGRWLLL